MQKHRFVFKVLVQRLEDFRTKYIWKCGSFGKGSTRREDMDKLNVLCTHLQSPAAVQFEKVSQEDLDGGVPHFLPFSSMAAFENT
jgi:hypothetical protein